MKNLTIRPGGVKSAQFLREKGVGTPRLDAELLLAQALSCAARSVSALDRRWTKSKSERCARPLRRRGQRREPVERIIGQREFLRAALPRGGAAFVPRPKPSGLSNARWRCWRK
jgi:release factor glutamine methyltransferase